MEGRGGDREGEGRGESDDRILLSNLHSCQGLNKECTDILSNFDIFWRDALSVTALLTQAHRVGRLLSSPSLSLSSSLSAALMVMITNVTWPKGPWIDLTSLDSIVLLLLLLLLRCMRR